MAEASVGRALRDGSLEGEHAAALSIKDTLSFPLGSSLFVHFLRGLVANVSSARSSASGLVLIAFDRSPSLYFDLLKNGDSSFIDSRGKWFQIVDCYSDPIGWKKRHLLSSLKGDGDAWMDGMRTVIRDVKDVDQLCSSVLEVGRGMVGEGKARFAVAIDSVSVLLRHTSLTSVADQVSTMFWLVHSDLHEPRVCAAFDYLSTMVGIVEPRMEKTSGEKCLPSLLNSCGGRFHLRLKRRNGRVRILYEEFYAERGGIRFSALSSEKNLSAQALLPKVQFNLQLSEKERMDKARVVLPFEHQGNGEIIHIYDGRGSHQEGQKDVGQTMPASCTTEESKEGGGEIHYVRDSDDEMPDSDEDPDDDLDI